MLSPPASRPLAWAANSQGSQTPVSTVLILGAETLVPEGVAPFLSCWEWVGSPGSLPQEQQQQEDTVCRCLHPGLSGRHTLGSFIGHPA